MLRLTATNTSNYRISHRRAIEYPGFVLPAHLEPGEQCSVSGEPMVIKHQHTDGHLYNIYFYRLQAGDKYVYICDFNPEFPSQRTITCDGRYSDLPTTTIINVGTSPYAFRAGPTYPGTKLSGFLEKGESATVFSEFRLIPFMNTDDHVYYIHSYKLADKSGWIPDFDPDHPDKRTMHDKCGFSLTEIRHLAQTYGLREVHHDPAQCIVAFMTPDHAKVIAYYATGTVATSMHHPRQGTTQIFRRNQTLEGLREVFLNPGIYSEIGYLERGRKRGPNSPGVARNTNCSPIATAKMAADEILEEEEAIKRQLKKLESEAMYMDLERQRLNAALESYERHRVAERRREKDREHRMAQQLAAQKVAERNASRGTEMVCHTSNNAFVRKHWEGSVSSVALGTKCEFLMYEGGAMACSDPEKLPAKMLEAISDRDRHVRNPPRYCALGSGGRYFLSFGEGGMEREWVGSEAFGQALQDLAARERPKAGAKAAATSAIRAVSFGESRDSWVILLQDGACLFSSAVPARLQALLTPTPRGNGTVGTAAAAASPTKLPPPPPPPALSAEKPYLTGGGDIEEVSLGPAGEWFLLRRSAKAGEWESRSSKFLNAAKAIKTKITAISFGSDFTYLIRHK